MLMPGTAANNTRNTTTISTFVSQVPRKLSQSTFGLPCHIGVAPRRKGLRRTVEGGMGRGMSLFEGTVIRLASVAMLG